MSNSPRGESAMYPRIQPELYEVPVNTFASGSNLIVVTADDMCIAWGAPVAGKIGLEGDASSCSSPKYVVFAARDVTCVDVSCGYGHVCYIVRPHTNGATIDEASFPKYPFGIETPEEKNSKKRKEPAAAAPGKKSRK